MLYLRQIDLPLRCVLLGHAHDELAYWNGYELCERCGIDLYTPWHRRPVSAQTSLNLAYHWYMFKHGLSWRWQNFKTKHRLGRCPECHRIERWGDHNNCLPF